MFKSLGARIALIHVCYMLLLCAVVLTTGVVLQKQKDDGLVVNLSGRQRMLTQRMTHQLLGYAAQAESGADTAATRQAVLLTMQVFETTLHALERGGPAPMDLQMVQMRDTPAASPAVGTQLARVSALYQPFRAQARAILEGDPTRRRTGVRYVIDQNTELLSEMTTAVNLMQAEAEKRVQTLYYVQAGAVLLGLFFCWILSSITRRTVVEPLRELNQMSDAMSRGDMHRRIVAQGPREIHELGSSFERLRVSMKNLLRQPQDDGLTL
jgi:methyl-accepting chemotaxis protein